MNYVGKLVDPILMMLIGIALLLAIKFLKQRIETNIKN